jgi:hypothetical protein
MSASKKAERDFETNHNSSSNILVQGEGGARKIAILRIAGSSYIEEDGKV